MKSSFNSASENKLAYYLRFLGLFTCMTAFFSVLVCHTPIYAATRTITFPNGNTVTLADDGTITGEAATKADIYRGLTTQDNMFEVTMPDGTKVLGDCLDLYHPAPADGSYPFRATPRSDGGFDVLIDSSNAEVHQGEQALFYETYGFPLTGSPQRVGNIRWYPVLTGKLELQKSSSMPEITLNNPCYSLEGATFAVYADKACTDKLENITTDANGHAELDEIPAGNVYVKETSAPKGYALDTQVYEVHVDPGATGSVSVSEAPQSNPIDVWVEKLDAETKRGKGLGGASLAGAEFEICYYDNTEGKTTGTPKRKWVVKTDANGQAKGTNAARVSGDEFYTDGTGAITVPIGTISIRETKAPAGYYLAENPTATVVIKGSGDGKTISMYVAPKFTEQVYRGDLTFNKVDEETMARMGNVTFRITSKTTGESHDVKTDANGIFESADSDLWFTGAKDITTKRVANKGRLPYDTYTITELRSKENEGRKLVSFEVTITKDKKVVALGTIDNKTIPVPEIGTTLTHQETHVAPADEALELIDTIDYTGLEKGATYTLKGKLIDKTTGKPVGIEAETTFVAKRTEGSEEVVFTFDARELAGKSLVAYESLFDVEGALVASHEDPDDDDQTVVIPKIGTTLTDAEGGKAPVGVGEIELVDTIAFENLVAGETYTFEGELMDKATGESLGITAESKVKVEATSGTVEVKFTFDAERVAGKSVVAFEQAVDAKGKVVARHEDIEDVDQTLEIPKIGTTLTDADGEKAPSGVGKIELVDTIAYENLVVGETYTFQGELMDKETGKSLGVTSEAEATIESSPGTVEVRFTFDAGAVVGKTIVAFERALDAKGNLVARHEDIEDADQSLNIPDIGTSLTGTKDEKELVAAEKIELVDHVSYTNLVPGTTYKVTGELMYKMTGEGTGIFGETEFECKESSGTADIHFTFDASKLGGLDLVAFEELYDTQGKLVAEHKDLKDKDQTITITKKPVVPSNPVAKVRRVLAQTGLGAGGAVGILVGAGILACLLKDEEVFTRL